MLYHLNPPSPDEKAATDEADTYRTQRLAYGTPRTGRLSLGAAFKGATLPNG